MMRGNEPDQDNVYEDRRRLLCCYSDISKLVNNGTIAYETSNCYEKHPRTELQAVNETKESIDE